MEASQMVLPAALILIITTYLFWMVVRIERTIERCCDKLTEEEKKQPDTPDGIDTTNKKPEDLAWGEVVVDEELQDKWHVCTSRCKFCEDCPESQTPHEKEKACWKCGSKDHLARDCTKSE